MAGIAIKITGQAVVVKLKLIMTSKTAKTHSPHVSRRASSSVSLELACFGVV
jgi:hypothetical protein